MNFADLHTGATLEVIVTLTANDQKLVTLKVLLFFTDKPFGGLGDIGVEAAVSSLVNKINYQNREVETYALHALKKLHYQADEKVLPSVLEVIKLSVQHIAWFLAAQHTIQENSMGEPIKSSIDEELNNAQDHLYLLLSIAYDPNSIHHIRENLESGTSEGIGFAIELLDIFVADEVKPVLFPVLDDSSIVEKIRQLQVEFPVVIMEPYELLMGIINRDPNFISPVTRAGAIYMLSTIENLELTDDLIAQIFNPDDMLCELASLQVEKLNKELFGKVLDRLPAEKKSHLRKIITARSEQQEVLIWDKVGFVKQNPLFEGLPTILQYEVALRMERSDLKEGQDICISGNTDDSGFALVRDGNVSVMLNNKEIGQLSSDDLTGILPFMITEKDSLQIKAIGDSILYVMSQESLDELIFDYEEMAMVMYRWTKDQQEKKSKQTKAMVS